MSFYQNLFENFSPQLFLSTEYGASTQIEVCISHILYIFIDNNLKIIFLLDYYECT